MLAEHLVPRRDAAQVHDAADPGALRRFAEMTGGGAIRFAVVAVRSHRVHQVD